MVLLTVAALVLLCCGSMVAVQTLLFRAVLPTEQNNRDQEAIRRSLYAGPIPPWVPRVGVVSALAGLTLLLALLASCNFSVDLV